MEGKENNFYENNKAYIIGGFLFNYLWFFSSTVINDKNTITDTIFLLFFTPIILILIYGAGIFIAFFLGFFIIDNSSTKKLEKIDSEFKMSDTFLISIIHLMPLFFSVISKIFG